jgi:hypothetical protein
MINVVEEMTMTRNLSLCVVVLALTGDTAAAIPSQTPADLQHLTPTEAKTLAKQAHTPEQFIALAGYYNQMESKYLQKAADEKREWERRAQSTAALSQKYPRPVDSARNLYEYFMTKASEMESLKARNAQKAESVPSAAVK